MTPTTLALAALALWPQTTSPQTNPFDTRVDVRVHLPAAPARDAATARRSIATLERAALLACGGSDNSLAQVKAALRQSPCWHQAMTGALARIDDAALRDWWNRHPS